jgi:hypothetical protein
MKDAPHHLSGLIGHLALLEHRLARTEEEIREHMGRLEAALRRNARLQQRYRARGDRDRLVRLIAQESRLTASYQRLQDALGYIHIAPLEEEEEE